MLAGMVPALAAGPAETADSIYINGNIYTVDESFSTATAMAVKLTHDRNHLHDRTHDRIARR